METIVELRSGPLRIEMHLDGDDDYQTEVLNLIEFVRGNQDQFETLERIPASSETGGVSVESLNEFRRSENEPDPGEEEQNTFSGPLTSITKRIRRR